MPETEGVNGLQTFDGLESSSRIGRSLRCGIDDLRSSDVEFLRKVEAMQDSLAAANGPRCGPWLLHNS